MYKEMVSNLTADSPKTFCLTIQLLILTKYSKFERAIYYYTTAGQSQVYTRTEMITIMFK